MDRRDDKSLLNSPVDKRGSSSRFAVSQREVLGILGPNCPGVLWLSWRGSGGGVVTRSIPLHRNEIAHQLKDSHAKFLLTVRAHGQNSCSCQ